MRADYDAVLTVMTENQDEKKPVWLTELGCPGVPEFKKTQDWWLGENPDEKQQALWVKTLFTEPLRWPGMKKVFWAFFRDTPDHFLTGTDYFGLLREDFEKKPSFKTFRKMTSRWRAGLKDRGRA